MIKLIDFSKKYSGSKDFAVKNVNMEIPHGITALIGPNGAGKSTILSSILSITFPSQGKILVSDSEGLYFDSLQEGKKTRENCGFVSELSLVSGKKTVLEFLNDVISLHRPEKQLKNKNDLIKKYVKLLELEEVLDKKTKTLSRGFEQRLALAAAMIYEPENLILDEALSGLDPIQLNKVRKIILDYSKKHSVLFSSHIMQEVKTLSDNIYILNRGELLFGGSQQELFDKTGKKDLEEAFISCLEAQGK